LNPFEEVFSKWKNAIKRSNPNSVDDLNSAIINGRELILPEDGRAFLLILGNMQYLV
jgi:hypothetical protein